MDCIDRQAAIDALKGLPTWYGDAGCLPFGDPQPPMEALLYPDDAVSAIENLPLADVEPVRHGRWDMAWREDDGYRWHYHSCSVCHKDFDRFWNYCPNCGAIMDGGGENGDR